MLVFNTQIFAMDTPLVKWIFHENHLAPWKHYQVLSPEDFIMSRRPGLDDFLDIFNKVRFQCILSLIPLKTT